MLDDGDENSVLASHGRWIRELQESMKMIRQDLSIIEKRVSTFEKEIAERARNHEKIKSELSSMKAELEFSRSR